MSSITPEPLTESADPFDEAFAAARRAGYEEGKRAAAEEAATATKRAATRLDGRVAAAVALLENAALLVRAQLGEELDRVAKGATSLALEITEAILQRELELATNPGAEALARALALLPAEGPVVARCNPADLELLGPVERPMLRFVPDPEIAPGGCVVDTGTTLVDARIDTAMARVREILRRAGGSDD